MATVIQAIIYAAFAAFTKENLKTKTTAGSAVATAITGSSMAVSGVVPPDNLEAAITQIVGGVLAVVLFFIKAREAKDGAK